MAHHFFTSAAVNYLPKARVLAASIRRHHPASIIHLVLCDRLPSWFRVEEEPFDSVLTLDDLDLPADPGWFFSHNLVELSTAIKGFALVKLLGTAKDVESVTYFDPDIVVLAPLEELLSEFRHGSILLTPHSTVPDRDRKAIEDNEIVSLRHGTFNLGYLGVKNDEEGWRFARWWRNRLRDFCFDDVRRGLFTDQRWADLVPSFFAGYRILPNAAYNVCTWNLNSRVVTGNLRDGLLVNGQPLVFYHFSGFDRGDQKTMLQRYGRNMPALFDLRAWYKAACEEAGQSVLGFVPWSMNEFSDGQPILQSHRDLYRRDLRVRQWFPDPYQTGGSAPSYATWYRLNGEQFTPSAAAEADGREAVCPDYEVVVLCANGAGRQSIEAIRANTATEHIRVEDDGASLERIVAGCEGRDVAVVHEGVEVPWHWDLRLAWSAARYADAATVSPLLVTAKDGHWVAEVDRVAYWFRPDEDEEIATPAHECVYIRREFSTWAGDRGADGLRHRRASHVCVGAINSTSRSLTLDARNVDTPLLPEVRWTETAPTLHIVSAEANPIFEQYCCFDRDRAQLVFSTRGHARLHGTSFRLSSFQCRQWQRLQTWQAAFPIRIAALSHASYRAALHDVLDKHRPGHVVVWSLLGHSLDCLQTGLPTTVLTEALAVETLFDESEPSVNVLVFRRELNRTMEAPDVIALGDAFSHEDSESLFRALAERVPAKPEAWRYFAGPKAPAQRPELALQIYWDTGSGHQEGASNTAVPRGSGRQQLRLQVPPLTVPPRSLRLDIATEPALATLFELNIASSEGETLWQWRAESGAALPFEEDVQNQIVVLGMEGAGVRLACVGADGHFELRLDHRVLLRLSAGATVNVDIQFGEGMASFRELLVALTAKNQAGYLEQAHKVHLLHQELGAAAKSLGEAERKAEQLTRERRALEATVQDLTQSPSWRLTAPIRWLKRRLSPGEEARP